MAKSGTDILAMIKERQDANVKSQCQTRRAMELLGDSDRAGIIEAIRDEAIYGNTIAACLTEVTGVKVGEDSVRRHRRGACRCEVGWR